MTTDKQDVGNRLMSGSVTNDVSTDDIQVVSSEWIVVEDGVEDDVAENEQMLVQSKFLQTMGSAANLDAKSLFQKKADKAS